MISRFRVSSLLPRRLEELGLSLPTVLRQANLPLGLFSKEKILVTTEELFALYSGIAEVSRDPAIGRYQDFLLTKQPERQVRLP